MTKESEAKFPVAIDPETGHPEVLGKGRVAVIKAGSVVVDQVVSFPQASTHLVENPNDWGPANHQSLRDSFDQIARTRAGYEDGTAD